MSNYHWHTGDESGWGETPPVQEARARVGWRRWLLLIAAAATLATAAGLAYRQLDQRAEFSTDSRREELIATHILVQGLAGDGELLSRFLSGRDADWATAQELLLEEGLLFDRPGLGLGAVGSVDEDAIAGIELSPSLNSAVITTTRQYTAAIGSGLIGSFNLQQVGVYRRGPDRWLYAPPEDEFWGQSVTEQWPHLVVTYPRRDRSVAGRLARDISRKLSEWCTGAGQRCSDGLQLELRFSAQPASLRLQWPPAPEALESATIILPAPSLAGLPVDEAGYQALYRGYASHLLLRAMASEGTLPVEGSLLSFTLMEKQLARMGLQPWVVEPATFQLITEAPLTLAGLEYLWRLPLVGATERDRSLARALIDHLLLDQAASPAELAAALNNLGEGGYWPWLLLAAGDGLLPPTELEATWMAFSQEHAGTGN